MSEHDTREYKILGCALSDLSSDAAPFAVVVMDQVRGQSSLESYVLSDWDVRTDRFPPRVHQVMQNFIADLRSYEPGDETERFFLYLGSLGMGVIRLVKEGSLDGTHADEEITSFLNGAPDTAGRFKSFTRL